MLLAFSKQKTKKRCSANAKKKNQKKNKQKKHKKPKKRIENCKQKQNTLQTYLNLSETQRNSRKLH